jgi:hypothetical protein
VDFQNLFAVICCFKIFLGGDFGGIDLYFNIVEILKNFKEYHDI